MSDDGSLAVAISSELRAKLDRYARMADLPLAQAPSQAMEEYLDWRIPQLDDLQQSIDAADAGDFATEGEVRQTFRLQIRHTSRKR